MRDKARTEELHERGQSDDKVGAKRHEDQISGPSGTRARQASVLKGPSYGACNQRLSTEARAPRARAGDQGHVSTWEIKSYHEKPSINHISHHQSIAAQLHFHNHQKSKNQGEEEGRQHLQRGPSVVYQGMERTDKDRV